MPQGTKRIGEGERREKKGKAISILVVVVK